MTSDLMITANSLWSTVTLGLVEAVFILLRQEGYGPRIAFPGQARVAGPTCLHTRVAAPAGPTIRAIHLALAAHGAGRHRLW